MQATTIETNANEDIQVLKEDIRECLGVACNELLSAQSLLNELKESGGGDPDEIDEAIEKLNRLWDEVWGAWTGDDEL